MNATTPGKDRVKKSRLAKLKQGLVEVRVWVPKGMEQKIKDLAAKLLSHT